MTQKKKKKKTERIWEHHFQSALSRRERVQNGDIGWNITGGCARRQQPWKGAAGGGSGHTSTDHDACSLLRPRPCPPSSQILLSSWSQCLSSHRYLYMHYASFNAIWYILQKKKKKNLKFTIFVSILVRFNCGWSC